MKRVSIPGDWDFARGRLRQRYPQLTDADLTVVKGRETQRWARLKRKTGLPRREILRFLNEDPAGQELERLATAAEQTNHPSAA